MKLEWNPIKGEEGCSEAKLVATLKSVSENEFENKNGTKYRVATIKLEEGKESMIRTAIMYAGSYAKAMESGVELGDQLLGKAFFDQNKKNDKGEQMPPLLTISHLHAASRATINDFNLPEIAKAIEESKVESTEEVTNF